MTQQDVVVELDLDNMTVGDIVNIENWSRGTVPTETVIQLIQARVTNGVDLMSLPWSHLPTVLRQIRSAAYGVGAKNSSSG